MNNVYHAEDIEFGYGIKLYPSCRTGVGLKKA